MHYDLIVIGMGLSGLMAAKTAAEMGKKVLIAGKGMGSLYLFTNTIDILGKISEQTKMSHGLSQWIKDHPEHPYSKVGFEKIEEALSSFLSLFPPPYPFHTIGDRNCFIPTGAGTLRPAYLIPNTMLAGTSLKKREGLIIGFKGFKDFYVHYVADQLNCRGAILSLPEVLTGEITATALARRFEQKPFRETIGMDIKKHLKGETRVGLPAVLGIRDPLAVKKELEEMIGAEVFEIPILPPSIPGIRIFNRFKEYLIRKGITFLPGSTVSKAFLQGKRCDGLDLLQPPVSTRYSSDRYLLATGRFIGGGLVADEKKIFEPIFNLPVLQPGSREEWFQKTFFSGLPHPVHQAGILTDSSFRSVNGRGERLLENVWVAGSILSGHHCIEEQSREGIEIATGYMAAKWAMEGS